MELSKRGDVYSMRPLREGNGHSRMWRRQINGQWYSFTHVEMPDGEIRYAVSKYNGYGNHRAKLDGMTQAQADQEGMRWGCAWTPVHFIRIPAPAIVAPGEGTTMDIPTPAQITCLRYFAYGERAFIKAKGQTSTERACVRRGWLVPMDFVPASGSRITEAGRLALTGGSPDPVDNFAASTGRAAVLAVSESTRLIKWNKAVRP